MKKVLLSLCMVASAAIADAGVVTFVSEVGSYKPQYENEEIVKVPVWWTGKTIYCDAMNLYINGGYSTNRYSVLGGISMSNNGKATSNPPIAKSAGNAYMQFVPTGGVTIKKITLRCAASTVTPFDEMTVQDQTATEPQIQTWTGDLVGKEDLSVSKKFFLHYVENLIDGVDQTDHTKESTKVQAITVEYEGTPSRSKMPVANTGSDYIINKPVVLTTDEPGAKIMYSLVADAVYNVYGAASEDTGFEVYDGSPIALTEATHLQAYTVVDGKKKSGLFYKWYVPGPEDSHHAVFNYSDPASLGLDAGATPIKIRGMEFKNNGITYVNASKVSTNNSGRVMHTQAYCWEYDLRHAGGSYGNQLQFTTDNPENSICAVILVGGKVKDMYSAAEEERQAAENGNFTIVNKDYKFPDNVNFSDETALNYKTKMFGTILSGNAGRYIVQWRQSGDYEGEDPATKVIFDGPSGSDGSVINTVHVFYYGEAPNGDTGVNGIVADMVDENAPVEYYNLQGIRVANPQGGIFIRRQGNKVTKMYVK